MNRPRARHALVGTVLALTLLGTACSEPTAQTSPTASDPAPGPSNSTDAATPAPAPSAGTEIVRVDGYPLDRSLNGLLTFPDVDTIMIVKATKPGQPHLIKSSPKPGEDEFGDYVVTPIDARVDTVLRGSAGTKDEIRVVIGGGTVGDLQVEVGTEIAPSLKDLTQYSRLVVAGRTVTVDGLGTVLDLYFAYGVNGEGRLKTLMDSAGEAGTFTLDALRAGLADQR